MSTSVGSSPTSSRSSRYIAASIGSSGPIPPCGNCQPPRPRRPPISTRPAPSIKMMPTFARKPCWSMKSMARNQFFHILGTGSKSRPPVCDRLGECGSGSTLEVAPAGRHELDEARLVAALHEPPDPLRGGGQRVQRRGAVVVQRLNLEVQVGIVGRDQARDLELSVERRARHLLQPWHELAAL